MLAKKIKYKDYNGVEREETFYFNLKESELLEMELSKNGGVINYLERIVETKDAPEILKYFKKIILGSYGKKSLDGTRFEKSEEISAEFYDSEAYSVLVMEMFRNPTYAAEFINEVLPESAKLSPEELKKAKDETSI